jgi:hypothetical protein
VFSSSSEYRSCGGSIPKWGVREVLDQRRTEELPPGSIERVVVFDPAEHTPVSVSVFPHVDGALVGVEQRRVRDPRLRIRGGEAGRFVLGRRHSPGSPDGAL